MRAPSVGDRILDRYSVVGRVAVAGQGVVLKGIDERTGSEVAIKVLNTDPGSASYPQELARAHRSADFRFGHPSIVDPSDSGMHNGQFCVVFPFIAGSDLARVIARKGPLTAPRAVAVLLGVAEGLDAAHAQGVVHRDVKAENILVGADGRICIIDFGIARKMHAPTLTTGSGPLGTPSTMAPEQFDDPRTVDPRADIYSLGTVFYSMLAGQPAFPESTDLNALREARGGWPVPPSHANPAVPAELDQICLKMLAPDPHDRFQTVHDLMVTLEPIARQLGVRSVAHGGAASPPAAPRCLACGTRCGSQDECPGCRRVFGDVRHRLMIQTGPAAGEIMEAPQGSYIAGRAQIAPTDLHMSHRQLLVECSNGVLFASDGGGANPTLIEDQPIASAQALRPGARLRLGVSWAKYHLISRRVS